MKNCKIYGPFTRLSLYLSSSSKPLASDVLKCHIKQRNFPSWTSYFVKYKDVINDQFALSHFNVEVEGFNYHILRTGCYPFLKYHCTKRQYQNLGLENQLFLFLKILNLGLPTLAYGLGAAFLIKHEETVVTPLGLIKIYFLNEENNSMY